ncbi:glucosaminidase [Alteromonas sp. KUL42]|uniref:glucosaminidase domain-containing protein n=1 Tax=Alteromonas sp. KUL42 TaxID=2480797 RepID=UPI000AB1094A|nr:glucosaminidase domain-containing protein [Alteromonas sp. KUL42]GEA06195.1 glucosaminidase [Alteromonas sp. KUL42]
MVNIKHTRYIFIAVVALIVVVAVYITFFAKKSAPDFSLYEAGPERKAAFFNYFQPIVHSINSEILSDRKKVQKECEANNDSTSLGNMAKKYRLDKQDVLNEPMCNILLRRVDVIPASLALAQAANESAWGTSRFAVEANNFFGQWCFMKGCGVVPNKRDKNKTHEIADFRTPKDSVKSYMMNLNTHEAYRDMRKIRQAQRLQDVPLSGLTLSQALLNYSERKEEYVEEINAMIRFNNLQRFDDVINSLQAGH